MFNELILLYICTFIPSSNVCANVSLAYTVSSTICSNKQPFLTLWNIPLQECVVQCRIRKLCKSVNFWRRRVKCEMMTTDDRGWISKEDQIQPCIFVTMTSALDLYGVFAVCETCDSGTVCDTEAGTCDVRECSELHLAHARVNGNVHAVGARLIIQCDQYYELDNATLQPICLNTGSWGNVPNCIHIACSNPPDITNAVISTGDNVEGTVRDYTCASGFTAIDVVTMSVTCQPNGEWSAAQFECVITCNSPPGITNAVISFGDNVEGAIREYTCSSGYTAIDVVTMSVTCQGNGVWSTAEFACVKSCNSPPGITNAVISFGDYVEGAIREYTCSSGYTAIDVVTMSVTCQGNGVWSTAEFACVKLSCDTGWHRIGESCYISTTSTMNVGGAKSYCRNKQAYLVQYETEEEYSLVKSYLMSNYGNQRFFLGLTDEETEDVWKWMETGTVASFTKWIPGEPDRGTAENYAVLWAPGNWVDISGGSSCTPVCEKRYTNSDLLDTLYAAAALDPRFKSLPYVSVGDIHDIYQSLSKKALDIASRQTDVKIKEEPSEPNSSAESSAMPALPMLPSLVELPRQPLDQPDVTESKEEPALKMSRLSPEPLPILPQESKSSKNALESLFGDVFVTSVEPAKSLQQQVDSEIADYQKESVVPLKSDPLQWWKERAGHYPILSKLASRYLVIPATSVASERVFSTAGDIVNAQRGTLSSDNVNMLIFLKKNLNISDLRLCIHNGINRL